MWRPNSKPSNSCLTISKKKQFDREKNLNMREKVEFELYTLGNVEIKVAFKKYQMRNKYNNILTIKKYTKCAIIQFD